MVPPERKLKVWKVEEGRDEVENKKGCEKDWPNKELMDCYVNWVAVVSSIESKFVFKIKQSTLSHQEGQAFFFFQSFFVRKLSGFC